jgi:hypothetical protein
MTYRGPTVLTSFGEMGFLVVDKNLALSSVQGPDEDDFMF